MPRSIFVLLVTWPVLAHARQPSVERSLLRSIDSTFRAAQSDGFSGVIVAGFRDSIQLRKAYGTKYSRSTFDPSDIVPLHGVTASITKLAVLHLIEQEKLALDDSLGKWWTDLPQETRRIRIRQLLEHRSGLVAHGSPTGREFVSIRKKEFMDFIAKTSLLFSPGTSYSESSLGYNLLAAVIEQVSDESYDNFVARSVLKAAKVHEIGYHLPRFHRIRIAHGITRDGTDVGQGLGRPRDDDGLFWFDRGATGSYGRLDEVFRLFAAVYQDQVVGHELRQQWFPAGRYSIVGTDGVSHLFVLRLPEHDFMITVSSTSQSAPAVRLVKAVTNLIAASKPARAAQ